MVSTAVNPPVGPRVNTAGVTFRLPDAGHRLGGVRLWQEVRIPGDQLDFTYRRGVWRLRLPRPPVHRMEYLFELRHRDGGSETILDPHNPRRVAGAFGDHSVIEFPGYEAPAWWDAPAPGGTAAERITRSSNLSGEVAWRLWAPDALDAAESALLLVAHDGPEFDALAGLTTYAGALVASGALPPLRVAMLAPGPRDERYSANAAYARALARAVLPEIRSVAPSTAVIGMGASLGALSMLHLQRKHPALLDGLFLQSGSFFHRRLDAQDRRFSRFGRIERFVSETLRSETAPRPVPVAMTCGAIEENLENNRMMARALSAQGYDAELTEVADVHNYTAWRDALHPHLTELTARVAAA
jgi:enterochelin esterase-like enzyme